MFAKSSGRIWFEIQDFGLRGSSGFGFRVDGFSILGPGSSICSRMIQRSE